MWNLFKRSTPIPAVVEEKVDPMVGHRLHSAKIPYQVRQLLRRIQRFENTRDEHFRTALLHSIGRRRALVVQMGHDLPDDVESMKPVVEAIVESYLDAPDTT